MHARKFASHAFWPDARAAAIWLFAADAASAASRAARWARICSANAVFDLSFVDVVVSAINSLNWDDLSSIIISGSVVSVISGSTDAGAVGVPTDVVVVVPVF